MKAITNGEITIISLDHEHQNTYNLSISKSCQAEQINWLLTTLAKLQQDEGGIEEAFSKMFNIMQKASKKKLELVEIHKEIPFDQFWDEYNYKKGNKTRVEKIWSSMQPVERTKAFYYIKKYKFFLAQNPSIQPKFPQTFLNCQEWNN